MTDDTPNDATQITEPSMTAGEVEMLRFALDRSRAQLAWKTGGLDDAGLRATHPPTTMTLGGLLVHLALVEDEKTSAALEGRPLGPPWSELTADPGGGWVLAASMAAEDVHELWHAAVDRSRAAFEAMLGEGGLDRPAAFTWPDGDVPNVRRVLVDLHDEYARHVGHADLLREALDGLVGEDPPQR